MTNTVRYNTGRASYKLLALAILLSGIGTFFLYDFSRNIRNGYSPGNYVFQQLLGLIIGIFTAIVLSNINYHSFSKISRLIFYFTLILCFAYQLELFPSFISISNNRYIKLGPLSFDLYALTVFSTCLIIPVFSRLRMAFPLPFLIYFILSFMPSMLILSSSCFIICLSVWWGLCFLKKPVPAMLIMLLFLFGIIYINISYLSYSTHFSQFQSQLLSRIAASGGMFGLGIGKSPYTTFFNMPGYMLPGITSEIGWFGIAFLLIIYFAFLLESAKITYKAIDGYGFSLGAVLTIKFMMTIILHFLVIVGFLPYAEIDLPFIRCSGSGLMMDFLFVGILLNISRQFHTNVRKQ